MHACTHKRLCIFAQGFSCVRERAGKNDIDPPPVIVRGGGNYKYIVR